MAEVALENLVFCYSVSLGCTCTPKGWIRMELACDIPSEVFRISIHGVTSLDF